MAGELKLGLNTGYWAGGPPPGVTESIAEAERLGFDSIWTAEAYGSDCLTPLAWWGASTSKIKLGTAIVQMSARQPAATAMAAMTMDHLSGGRFILGLGVSGPQVVEGWYGMPFAKPLARTREYIGILRDIWARKGPVTADGEHYKLPLPGGTGLGEAAEVLDPSAARGDPDLPRRRGAEEHRAVRGAVRRLAVDAVRAGAPADLRGRAQRGLRARRARATRPETFEVNATVPLIVSDDIDAAADALRPFYALYFGGMGAKGKNFHANVAIRMGYEAEVDEIASLYLEGKKDEAGAKVPRKLIEDMSLIGPKEKIRDDLAKWRESIVDTLLISGDVTTLRDAAELVLG